MGERGWNTNNETGSYERLMGHQYAVAPCLMNSSQKETDLAGVTTEGSMAMQVLLSYEGYFPHNRRIVLFPVFSRKRTFCFLGWLCMAIFFVVSSSFLSTISSAIKHGLR